MYYSVDDNGNVIAVESSSDLPLQFHNLPEIPDLSNQLAGSMPGTDTVSSGDPTPAPDPYAVPYVLPDYVTTQDLQDYASLYAVGNDPQYISERFLHTFEDVLDGLPAGTPYFITQSTDTSRADLYYSKDPYNYTISGNELRLTDCAHVYLSRYRPNTQSPYQYLMTVDEYYGDASVSFSGNHMLYTNCLQGYPDISPMQTKFLSETARYGIILCLFILVVLLFKGGRKHD